METRNFGGFTTTTKTIARGIGVIGLLQFAYLVVYVEAATAAGSTRRSSRTCPDDCRCVDTGAGTTVTCRRGSLAHVPRSIPPDTTTVLDLDHNHISLLQNDSIPSTVWRLEVLSLQDNGLLHVEVGVFAALTELRILRLGRNHLSTLPRDVFAANRKLEVLDLHANYFSVLPDQAVYQLHVLRLLNVSFNHLTTPELGPGFHFTKQLSVIDLSGKSRELAIHRATQPLMGS